MENVGRVSALLMVLSAISTTRANFNLFLSQAEVHRILGLTSELFYVREGVVNDYAINWLVPVPADVHSLFFTWQATTKKDVLYNMAIWINDTQAYEKDPPLATPFVNVSLTGHVPHKVDSFELVLPCTGSRSAEVDVTLNINVTSPKPRKPPTVLYFRRKKICLEGKAAERFAPRQDPAEEKDEEGSLPVIYYVVSVIAGVALVIIVIVAVALCRRRRRKRDGDQRILSANNGGTKTGNMTSSTLLRAPTPNNNTYTLPSSLTSNSYASVRKLPSPLAPLGATQGPVHSSTSGVSLTPSCRDNNTPPHLSRDASNVSGGESSSRDTCQSSSSLSHSEVIVDPSHAELQDRFRQMEIDRHRVRLTAVVQEGSFGRVFRGWIQRDHPEQDQQVLIKTVTEGAPHDELVLLYREGTHLFNLYHRNILTMVGVSFANNSSPFLIYPFHGYQNLKRYLLEHRGGHLRATELVELAIHAAHALSFLHKANILHGDIAARNCVVSEKLQLRITDAALSRDLFPADYESVRGELVRPIKWMAYEAITQCSVSTASDVWSYGVLVWELTTLAQQPYVEVAACEMDEYLRDGYRLVQPLNCPDDLYKVMVYCWNIHPKGRPHVDAILSYLSDFQKKLNVFI
ncbi:tyrosine-protein kinase Dnt-like isoform X2 [Macrobrachium nipponense]|uniref:tyrosine-protein kinase Dnt-like isoform X2 n=1 Tax=Macrobrachium nipponense TaxID=159736 RepID=UPI0030C7F437